MQLPTPAASEAVSLLGMIERAVADPSVDLDRIERMYEMFEKATARAARSAYIAAVARARAALPAIVKRGEIKTNARNDGGGRQQVKQSTFAKWEDVVETILPVLRDNDLTMTFRTSQDQLDRVSVTAVLSHVDGHEEQSQMALPIENSGSKNNAQGWGSSVSYGKRYTSFALLNLVGRDEDNDGRGACVDDEQQAALMQRIGEVGQDIDGFLTLLGAPSLADIPATSFQTAMNLLNAKARAKASKAAEGGGK